MMRSDEQDFFDYFQGLWPKDFSDAERGIWLGALKKPALEQAKRALSACYEHKTARPTLADFRAKLGAFVEAGAVDPLSPGQPRYQMIMAERAEIDGTLGKFTEEQIRAAAVEAAGIWPHLFGWIKPYLAGEAVLGIGQMRKDFQCSRHSDDHWDEQIIRTAAWHLASGNLPTTEPRYFGDKMCAEAVK